MFYWITEGLLVVLLSRKYLTLKFEKHVPDVFLTIL